MLTSLRLLRIALGHAEVIAGLGILGQADRCLRGIYATAIPRRVFLRGKAEQAGIAGKIQSGQIQRGKIVRKLRVIKIRLFHLVTLERDLGKTVLGGHPALTVHHVELDRLCQRVIQHRAVQRQRKFFGQYAERHVKIHRQHVLRGSDILRRKDVELQETVFGLALVHVQSVL